MQSRGEIPPGLPNSRPSTAYWQEPPAQIADHRTTPDLPAAVDYIVIGSGVSGAFVAYNILLERPGAKVLMLEARQACSGASGRNGGHTKPSAYRLFLENERVHGTAEAVRIVKLEYAGLQAMHSFANEHGIDCANSMCGTVDVYYCKKQFDARVKAVQRMRQVMREDDPAAKYQIWDAEQTSARFLCAGAHGSIQYEGGSIDPYKLTIGVLQLALERGLNLQTHTPAHHIHQHPSGSWIAQTSRGVTEAPDLILATNGYTAHLLPSMQSFIVPQQGQVVAHMLDAPRLPRNPPATYTFIQETGHDYMVAHACDSTQAWRIVVGGGIWTSPDGGVSRFGNSDDTHLDLDIHDYLRVCIPDYFGLSSVEATSVRNIKSAWCGVMAVTADGFPYVGLAPGKSNIWIIAGFNGQGMVWCLKAAEALVGKLVGDAAAQSAVDVWFPRCAWATTDRLMHPFKGRRDFGLRTGGE